MTTHVDHGERRQPEAVSSGVDAGPSRELTGAGQAVGVPTPGTVEDRLRAELDDLTVRLYGAVDAARGAEAEKANALGLVRDLEYQVHMLEVEIDWLRAQLGRSNVEVGPEAVNRRIAARLRRLASRLLGTRSA